MTGIIGAGKVGCSLGRFLMLKGQKISGYYDADLTSAKEAAFFTGTNYESDIASLVQKCDTLFLTVPDGIIKEVWDQIKDMPITGKFICHCSGALSAEDAFYGIKERGAFGYSIHPLFAVSDKYNSYKELTKAYFTMEGDQEHIKDMADLFRSFGNEVCIIKKEDKVRYHCAAATASNLVVGLIRQSLDLMEQCGFHGTSAREALSPIILGNIEHILQAGTTKSLTGPVERCDVSTVAKHLECLNGDDRELYQLLSKKLIEIGKEKNPDRNYDAMIHLLNVSDMEQGERKREVIQ